MDGSVILREAMKVAMREGTMITKKRNWWIAGILSLFEPGLGQIYNGQARKGLLILILPFLFLPLLFVGVMSGNMIFMLSVFVLLAVVYYIAVVADAIVTARKIGDGYVLKKYNRVVLYLAIIVIAGITSSSISAYFKQNQLQAFKIPAASMEPTVLVGDHILVDRRLAARSPGRGDLIVFEYPEDPRKDFIKRVVAIGGDKVAIRNKALFVNEKPVKEPYVVHKEADLIPAEQNPRDNFGPVTVPVGSCLVLGDNRDRSYDSRFWGCVELSKIKGTVKSIYWSWDRKNQKVRWERIGQDVR